jgi:hypothetical protein
MKAMVEGLGSADDDGDGRLDHAELSTLDPKLYETLGITSVAELLHTYDRNGASPRLEKVPAAGLQPYSRRGSVGHGFSAGVRRPEAKHSPRVALP